MEILTWHLKIDNLVPKLTIIIGYLLSSNVTADTKHSIKYEN